MLEMVFMDLFYKVPLGIILMKSLDSLRHLSAFTDALVDKVHRYQKLAQNFAERMDRTSKRTIEDVVKKKDDNLINELSSKLVSSLNASSDSSIARAVLPAVSEKREKSFSSSHRQETENGAVLFFTSHLFRCQNCVHYFWRKLKIQISWSWPSELISYQI